MEGIIEAPEEVKTSAEVEAKIEDEEATLGTSGCNFFVFLGVVKTADIFKFRKQKVYTIFRGDICHRTIDRIFVVYIEE